MSVAELKSRLRDVPGIEGLTMQALMGRQNFSFNGIIASVDADATVQEIEDAVRNASAKHLASPEPLRVGSSSGEPEPSVTLAPGPGENQTRTPLPTVNLTEPQPMTTPASPTGFVPGEIASLFKNLRDRKTAMVTELMTNGAEFAAILETGERQAAALKAESDAMKAEFGLTTNNPPA